MKALTPVGKILEIILKGTAVLLCLLPALLIEIVRVLWLSISKGFPSLADELTSVLDSWFGKTKTLKTSPEELDIVPIIYSGIKAMLDKQMSVYVAHAIYTDKEIETDIEVLIKQVKGQI